MRQPIAGLEIEEYTAGDLNDLKVVRAYDGNYRKLASAQLFDNTTPLQSTAYTYHGDTGRLQTVNSNSGAATATYAYHADSPLVSAITFNNGGTNVLATTKNHDFLNRLSSVSSDPSGETMNASYAYRYNDASQRTQMTLADGSYWVYGYDNLGQVTGGKRYWSSGVAVAGQQHEYAFDDIGNRTGTEVGGDEDGENLRAATYTSDYHNQYDPRTNPDEVNLIGIANVNAAVQVNGNGAYRHGEYFRYELAGTNGQLNSVTVTNVADAFFESGSVYIPPASEAYTYDLDGNLTQDGRWDYVWDAENRLISMTKRNNETFGEKIEFEYDWMGRRISKKVYDDQPYDTPDEHYVYAYDGWNLIGELEDDLTPIRTYVWGLDMSGSMQGAGGVGGLLMLNDQNEATHSRLGANFSGMVPERASCYSGPRVSDALSKSGCLSLIVRTLQHTGHPHPVLSPPTGTLFSEPVLKAGQKRDSSGSVARLSMILVFLPISL